MHFDREDTCYIVISKGADGLTFGLDTDFLEWLAHITRQDKKRIEVIKYSHASGHR